MGLSVSILFVSTLLGKSNLVRLRSGLAIGVTSNSGQRRGLPVDDLSYAVREPLEEISRLSATGRGPGRQLSDFFHRFAERNLHAFALPLRPTFDGRLRTGT